MNNGKEYCSLCNRDLSVQRKEQRTQKVDRLINSMQRLINEALLRGDKSLADALLVKLIDLKEMKQKHEDRLMAQKLNESVIQASTKYPF